MPIEDITPGTLGFGTDGRHEEVILKAVIEQGYKLIDTAERYHNKELIGKVIRETNRRQDVFINHKIMPDNFIQDANSGLITFDYIDCLMYHIPPYDNIPDDQLSHLKHLLEQGKIRYIGISNVHSKENLIRFDERLKASGLQLSMIQERFNTNIIDDSMGLLNECNIRGIRFMAYDVFGGKHYGECQIISPPTDKPYINFHEITHPNITNVAQQIRVDKRVLIAAFLSKRYHVIQIPTTSNINRVKTNFDGFNKAYMMLTDDMLNAIYDDVRKYTDKELVEQDPDKQVVKYRSRGRLIDYLKTKDFIGFKLLDIIYTDKDVQHLRDDVLYAMLYMIELSLENDKFKEFDQIINEIYQIISHKPMPIKYARSLKSSLTTTEHFMDITECDYFTLKMKTLINYNEALKGLYGKYKVHKINLEPEDNMGVIRLTFIVPSTLDLFNISIRSSSPLSEIVEGINYKTGKKMNVIYTSYMSYIWTDRYSRVINLRPGSNEIFLIDELELDSDTIKNIELLNSMLKELRDLESNIERLGTLKRDVNKIRYQLIPFEHEDSIKNMIEQQRQWVKTISDLRTMYMDQLNQKQQEKPSEEYNKLSDKVKTSLEKAAERSHSFRHVLEKYKLMTLNAYDNPELYE